MTTSASAKINVVNHSFDPGTDRSADRCSVTGCYASLRNHPDYVTAVYNWTYAKATVSLPGAMSEGKLVAAHHVAAKAVASIFRIR